MEIPQSEDHIESNENMLSIYPQPPSMLQDPSTLYPFNPHTSHSIQSPQFHSLTTGPRIQSLSPNRVPRLLRMHSNPFNHTMNIGIIPGPISLRCDNIQFTKSWIKYICQSAISVTSHTISFLITILWIRFLFSSYYQFQYDNRNDTSSYTLSIFAYIPFSSWLWITICLTHIIFILGFMIQTWIIPIQWNFEDNSNTKLFRYFGISFILLVILTTFSCTILQMLSYSVFYNVLTVSQLIVVMFFSFVLLFVIIKNGRNSTSLTYPSATEDVDPIDLSSDPSDLSHLTSKQIYKTIKQKTKRGMNIIAVFSTHESCFKLVLICALFSCIITATIAFFYINFHFVFSFILANNQDQNVYFERHFMTHLMITMFGTLFIGDLLILCMRVLMRWLTILLSGSYNSHHANRNSISFSYNAHYGSMQSFNRMILFAIPLMFIIKLTVFVMLYTFIDAVEFAVAITTLCIFSRGFNKIRNMIENGMLHKLTNDDDFDYYDDQNALQNLQDEHFLAQCGYIHNIIHYIATLLVPLMFGLFGVNLQNSDSVLPAFHYVQTTIIQFVIQSIFDLLPFLVILLANPRSTTHSNHESVYHLSQNMEIVTDDASGSKFCQITGIAMNLKIQYINMMNGWTATDKCVRHFMWWCTIFIGGYFAFYLLYPQQFLCAVKDDRHSIIFDDWIYIQCQ